MNPQNGSPIFQRQQSRTLGDSSRVHGRKESSPLRKLRGAYGALDARDPGEQRRSLRKLQGGASHLRLGQSQPSNNAHTHPRFKETILLSGVSAPRKTSHFRKHFQATRCGNRRGSSITIQQVNRSLPRDAG